MSKLDVQLGTAGLNGLAKEIHKIRVDKGFYNFANEMPQGDPQMRNTVIVGRVAHIHAEVSELFEAYRNGSETPCDKGIPLTAEQEELADIILMTLDLAAFRGVDISRAIKIKLEYDRTRPYLHNKNF